MKKTTTNLIQALIKQYTESSPKVWQIQPPQKAGQKSYNLAVQKVENLRGRALLYPYLGSGKGRGVYVQLLDGSIKMDLLCGVGVQILGHAHPAIQKAVLKGGLSNVLTQGHLLVNQEYLHLSQKLIELAQKKSRLSHVWLTTSGSMAGENVLKVARQKNSPRRKILAFDRAFAGRTTMMSEITSNPKIKDGLPRYNEVLRIPFYNPKKPHHSLKVLKSHLKKEGHNIAVFVFEIVLGEGGYKSAPREFFISLFKECRKYNIALWADEVQTFLRTGSFFAFEKWDLGPYIDLCTVGKGLQLAGAFWTKEYNPRPNLVSGTFSASTPALATGLKILNILEKGYMGKTGHIAKIETQFVALFQELKEKTLIKDYDVFGLMASFSLPVSSISNTKLFLKKLFQNGVIALSCGTEHSARVRFLLPAIITKKDIKKLREILLHTLSTTVYKQNLL